MQVHLAHNLGFWSLWLISEPKAANSKKVKISSFLFQSRFNKKKKSGPYKEAIRQATNEASDISQKILHSPLRSIMSSPSTVRVS